MGFGAELSADPFAVAADAATVIRALGGGTPDVAIVLGTGWQPALHQLGEPLRTVPFSELPGFSVPGAQGHEGRLVLLRRGATTVAVLAGRIHLYEGHSAAEVAHAVRSLGLSGARTLVLTNSAGAIRPEYPVGEPVLIRDHLNLTGTSPLLGGPPPPSLAPRFIDMTETYDAWLRQLARQLNPKLREGIYAGVLGPQYETPAEIAMMAAAGAGLVGMSTVVEAIAARHLGIRLLGLSLVTNRAAGMAAGPLDPADVLRVSSAAAPSLGGLLAQLVDKL